MIFIGARRVLDLAKNKEPCSGLHGSFKNYVERRSRGLLFFCSIDPSYPRVLRDPDSG